MDLSGFSDPGGGGGAAAVLVAPAAAAAAGSATSTPAAVAASRPNVNNRQRWHDLDDRSGSRAERTVRVTLPIEGKPYQRDGFIGHITSAVGLQELEAIGPSNQGHVWNITFQTMGAKEKFVAGGDFFVGDKRAQVAGVRANKIVLRVHWLPYHVPMAAITEEVRRIAGVKVLSANFEMANIGRGHQAHSVRTLVRAITVEATTAANVPHIIQWRHGGASGQALVTVRGRAGACLRCFSTAHYRKDCDAVKCDNCRKWGNHATVDCTVASSWATRTAPDSQVVGELHEEDQEPQPGDDTSPPRNTSGAAHHAAPSSLPPPLSSATGTPPVRHGSRPPPPRRSAAAAAAGEGGGAAAETTGASAMETDEAGTAADAPRERESGDIADITDTQLMAADQTSNAAGTTLPAPTDGTPPSTSVSDSQLLAAERAATGDAVSPTPPAAAPGSEEGSSDVTDSQLLEADRAGKVSTRDAPSAAPGIISGTAAATTAAQGGGPATRSPPAPPKHLDPEATAFVPAKDVAPPSGQPPTAAAAIGRPSTHAAAVNFDAAPASPDAPLSRRGTADFSANAADPHDQAAKQVAERVVDQLRMSDDDDDDEFADCSSDSTGGEVNVTHDSIQLSDSDTSVVMDTPASGIIDVFVSPAPAETLGGTVRGGVVKPVSDGGQKLGPSDGVGPEAPKRESSASAESGAVLKRTHSGASLAASATSSSSSAVEAKPKRHRSKREKKDAAQARDVGSISPPAGGRSAKGGKR